MRVDQGGGGGEKNPYTNKNELFNFNKVQLFPTASYAFN